MVAYHICMNCKMDNHEGCSDNNMKEHGLEICDGCCCDDSYHKPPQTENEKMIDLILKHAHIDPAGAESALAFYQGLVEKETAVPKHLLTGESK